MNKKIREWHQMVIKGLVGGLSRVQPDLYKRKEDIEFWRRRCNMFDAFTHCIMDLETNQDWSYSEKDLKQWSDAGYINKTNSVPQKEVQNENSQNVHNRNNTRNPGKMTLNLNKEKQNG